MRHGEAYSSDERLSLDRARLEFALKSLENPGTVRIGITTTDGTLMEAFKVARLFLADPLTEEAEWERDLLKMSDREGVAFLLQ